MFIPEVMRDFHVPDLGMIIFLVQAGETEVSSWRYHCSKYIFQRFQLLLFNPTHNYIFVLA